MNKVTVLKGNKGANYEEIAAKYVKGKQPFYSEKDFKEALEDYVLSGCDVLVLFVEFKSELIKAASVDRVSLKHPLSKKYIEVLVPELVIITDLNLYFLHKIRLVSIQ